MSYWSVPFKDLFARFESSERGLSHAQVTQKLKKYGTNEIAIKGKKTWLKILIAQFANPLIVLLLSVVVFSLVTQDSLNAFVIFFMIGINTVLGFSQEYKAHKSIEKLQNLLVIKSKVLRDGKIIFLNSKQVVPGDIVTITKGDYVPADMRLIEVENLIMNEATLTGESRDIAKSLSVVDEKYDEPQLITNGAFQGTYVSEGVGIGIVVATARNTFLGQTIQLSKDESEKTNFMKKLEKFSNILFLFVICITVIVFIINISVGRDIISSLILGITLALGLAPETMPVVLSIALATAGYDLSKKNLLIKRLNVFEDLGNIDVICADKTGTITQGILTPEHFFDKNFLESHEVKYYGGLCNAYNPALNFRIAPNQIDEVLWSNLKEVEKQTLTEIHVDKVWNFSYETRLMGVVTKNTQGQLLVVKGAFEQILEMCDVSQKEKKDILDKLHSYEAVGYRITGIAKKIVSSIPHSLEDVTKLELVGFNLLSDNPRDNMKHVFSKLEQLSVHLKIITGDSPEVTKDICEKVGLEISKNTILSGEDLEQIKLKSYGEFLRTVNEYNVFARVAPQQKLEIVKALKELGHVVGYVGDGINDVGALKIADVGITVQNAPDVTKDCSDIIILDRELTTIINGVVEGRKIFNNTMKFIFSTMSSSFGNVITITFASFYLKFIPLLPVQIIMLDSVTDFQHLAIAGDPVDPELLDKPRNWDMKIFTESTIFWGIISTVFDMILILVITSVTSSAILFRTTWLIESVLTELVATFSLRTPRLFFKSKQSPLMLLSSLVPFLFILIIPFTAIGEQFFGMTPPSINVLIIVFALVATYLGALELLKRRYFQRFWGIDYGKKIKGKT